MILFLLWPAGGSGSPRSEQHEVLHLSSLGSTVQPDLAVIIIVEPVIHGHRLGLSSAANIIRRHWLLLPAGSDVFLSNSCKEMKWLRAVTATFTQRPAPRMCAAPKYKEVFFFNVWQGFYIDIQCMGVCMFNKLKMGILTLKLCSGIFPAIIFISAPFPVRGKKEKKLNTAMFCQEWNTNVT